MDKDIINPNLTLEILTFSESPAGWLLQLSAGKKLNSNGKEKNVLTIKDKDGIAGNSFWVCYPRIKNVGEKIDYPQVGEIKENGTIALNVLGWSLEIGMEKQSFSVTRPNKVYTKTWSVPTGAKGFSRVYKEKLFKVRYVFNGKEFIPAPLFR